MLRIYKNYSLREIPKTGFMDFGLLYENDAGEYIVLNDVRTADIRLDSLVYLLVYVSTNCVPIAHLRQNKQFPLLYLGHAQIIREHPVVWEPVFVSGSAPSLTATAFCNGLLVDFSLSDVKKQKEIDVFYHFTNYIQSLNTDGLQTTLKSAVGSMLFHH